MLFPLVGETQWQQCTKVILWSAAPPYLPLKNCVSCPRTLLHSVRMASNKSHFNCWMTPCDRSWPDNSLLGEHKVPSQASDPFTPSLVNPKKTSCITSPNTLIVQQSVLPYIWDFESSAVDFSGINGEYTYWRGDTGTGYYVVSRVKGSEAQAEDMAKTLVTDPATWNWSLANVVWHYPVQFGFHEAPEMRWAVWYVCSSVRMAMATFLIYWHLLCISDSISIFPNICHKTIPLQAIARIPDSTSRGSWVILPSHALPSLLNMSVNSRTFPQIPSTIPKIPCYPNLSLGSTPLILPSQFKTLHTMTT